MTVGMLQFPPPAYLPSILYPFWLHAFFFFFVVQSQFHTWSSSQAGHTLSVVEARRKRKSAGTMECREVWVSKCTVMRVIGSGLGQLQFPEPWQAAPGYIILGCLPLCEARCRLAKRPKMGEGDTVGGWESFTLLSFTLYWGSGLERTKLEWLGLGWVLG